MSIEMTAFYWVMFFIIFWVGYVIRGYIDEHREARKRDHEFRMMARRRYLESRNSRRIGEPR